MATPQIAEQPVGAVPSTSISVSPGCGTWLKHVGASVGVEGDVASAMAVSSQPPGIDGDTKDC